MSPLWILFAAFDLFAVNSTVQSTADSAGVVQVKKMFPKTAKIDMVYSNGPNSKFNLFFLDGKFVVDYDDKKWDLRVNGDSYEFKNKEEESRFREVITYDVKRKMLFTETNGFSDDGNIWVRHLSATSKEQFRSICMTEFSEDFSQEVLENEPDITRRGSFAKLGRKNELVEIANIKKDPKIETKSQCFVVTQPFCREFYENLKRSNLTEKNLQACRELQSLTIDRLIEDVGTTEGVKALEELKKHFKGQLGIVKTIAEETSPARYTLGSVLEECSKVTPFSGVGEEKKPKKNHRLQRGRK